MSMTPVLRSLLVGSLCAGTLVLGASNAFAQKKAPSACGVSVLPLAAGNTWTWQSASDQLTITIQSITPGAGKEPTKIQVEEKLGERAPLALTWTCTVAAGLTVPPTSFLFLGEPGGGIGEEFETSENKGVTFPPDAALTPDSEHELTLRSLLGRKDMSGKGAMHPDANVEIERTLSPGVIENVEMATGTHKGRLLTIDVRGRAKIGEEVYEFPVKRPAQLWVKVSLGILRFSDAFDRDWDLVGTNLGMPAGTPVAAPAPEAPVPAQ